MVERPIRVVDFSTHLSGPLASHLLVGIGAEVIKVEHPVVGDGNRGMEPAIAGMGDLHVGLNPGTRSLAISTRSPHWPEVVAACAQWADGVLVGARPSDAERRGLDFSSFVQTNPEIVYCVMTGYGLKGPWANWAAHGQNPDSLAGRVDVEWEDGNPTTRPGWRTAGSPLAGVFGALGLLAGIVKRDRGGGAQFIHSSLWGSAMWWSWRDLNTLANLGHGWSDYGDKGSRYSMYTTSDDRILIVCPIEKKFWDRFIDLLELPEDWRERGNWEGGMFFGYDDERPTIAEHMRKRTLDEWVELLVPTDIPFAPVLTLEEAMESEHAAVNGVLQRTQVQGQDVRVAAPPVQIHPDLDTALAAEERTVPPPPELGEHTADALAEIGLEHLSDVDLGAPTTS